MEDTTVDPIKAVVEAKCPEPWDVDHQGQPFSHDQHRVCAGTGLRWPTLSRECDVCVGHLKEYRTVGCVCNGSGRVPDVTLEKVHDILWGTVNRIEYRPYECHLFFHFREPIVGRGESDLKAACSALLASVEEA